MNMLNNAINEILSRLISLQKHGLSNDYRIYKVCSITYNEDNSADMTVSSLFSDTQHYIHLDNVDIIGGKIVATNDIIVINQGVSDDAGYTLVVYRYDSKIESYQNVYYSTELRMRGPNIDHLDNPKGKQLVEDLWNPVKN